MNLKQRIEQQFEDLKTEGRRLQADQPQVSRAAMESDPSANPVVRNHLTAREAFGIRSCQLVENVCGKNAPHTARIKELPMTILSTVLPLLNLVFTKVHCDDPGIRSEPSRVRHGCRPALKQNSGIVQFCPFA